MKKKECAEKRSAQCEPEMIDMTGEVIENGVGHNVICFEFQRYVFYRRIHIQTNEQKDSFTRARGSLAISVFVERLNIIIETEGIIF